jgi:FMN phosphatase YigB (HAD superfamily)
MTAAVLFDLYETLVTERERTPARASGLGERLGIDAVAFRNAWKRQRHRIVRGEVTFVDGLLAAGFMCGRTLNDDLVQRLSRERRSEKALLFQHFDPVGFGVLRELRNRGCRLGVVSNCFAEDVAAWPSCQAAECFDASVFSFEVGCAKPEPPIYHEALRRLGVAASNAVFVGDGGDDELLGGERAGLRVAQAAWFHGDRAELPPRIPRLSSWSTLLDFAAG